MPIYEYECESCRHRLEKLQRIGDDPLTDCPECGRAALKRLISAAGFRLKGSGWYETDFKQDKRRNVAGDGDGGGSGGGESSGGEAGKSKSSDGESGKSSTADKKGAAKSSSEQAA